MGTDVLLEIKDLAVEFSAHRRKIQAVRGVDITILPGQFHALVGESGAGKTVTSFSVMRLLPSSAKVLRGSIRFQDHDLLDLSEDLMASLRGREISMIFQEPSKYLNPSMKAEPTDHGKHPLPSRLFGEGLLRPGPGNSSSGSACRTILPGWSVTPHEFSGGMKQRLMIAMAIACNPSLLIADEPTTALDVGVQRQIVNLLLELRKETRMALLYVTHNIGIVRYAADYISIAYTGKIIESAPKDMLLANPLHPYTRLLLSSIPSRDKRGSRLQGVPGPVPTPENIPSGCSFHTSLSDRSENLHRNRAAPRENRVRPSLRLLLSGQGTRRPA